MTASGTGPGFSAGAPALTPDERRWLHDKYERLAAEEGVLAAGRTSYYAAIGSVLVTGVVVAIADLSGQRTALAAVATFLAGLGILISLVWAVLLHRTNDAQALWREAARHIEESEPPIEGDFPAGVSLRTGATVTVNLLRPYEAHRLRFESGGRITWMDRVNPGRLTEVLPIAFIVIWVSVLTFAWVWYLT